MPFAGFPDFDACVVSMMKKEGYTKEIAQKVCGKLQAEHEKKHNEGGSHAPGTSRHKGMTKVALAFPQANIHFSDDPATGDTVFHDVTIMAEGTWTDSYSRTATVYSGTELAKMKFEQMTLKAEHDIQGTLPLTNNIGIIENARFMMNSPAKWLGDVRIFPTQTGKDIALLLKRKQITDISPEMYVNPKIIENADGSKILDARDIIFMGAATVRKGACSVCKFNANFSEKFDQNEGELESITKNETEGKTMTETKPPAEASGGAVVKELSSKSQDDISALEAQVKEAETLKASTFAVQFQAVMDRNKELEKELRAMQAKFTEIEHDTRVKELQRQLQALSTQPMINTQMSSERRASVALSELDNDDFPAVSVRDME